MCSKKTCPLYLKCNYKEVKIKCDNCVTLSKLARKKVKEKSHLNALNDICLASRCNQSAGLVGRSPHLKIVFPRGRTPYLRIIRSAKRHEELLTSYHGFV